ncbi:hypothetical protein KC19_VG245500 [Ceratodon purpureus]|uniref:Uncharacterized protein n=1 Tax=Ceratodon purpureus TaxID=3225 RepID=A0A8T0HTQ2_CERPU|nr:hypothetical protein KC19_VG245500 [Ceratodon purpureus]
MYNPVNEGTVPYTTPPTHLPPEMMPRTSLPDTSAEHIIRSETMVTGMQNPRSSPSVVECDAASEPPPTVQRCASVARIHLNELSTPSWASGETVPVTPSRLLQNFTNKMPIGTAVSTDVFASMGTTSDEKSPRLSPFTRPRSSVCLDALTECPSTSSQQCPNTNTVTDPAPNGETTRGMSIVAKKTTKIRPPRMRFELTLSPRMTSHALAANSLCYILHPTCGKTIVAEGRARGSWKCPSGKYGVLCAEGQQMVQVHKIIVPNLPLMHIEERHNLKTLDQALVKPLGSNVYVKWDTRLLWRRNKIPRAPPSASEKM